jgi:hypothetical protein
MEKKGKELPVRTWVEIDKKSIAHNYRVFRKLLKKSTRMMGIVKSNAYGHNLMEYAAELEKLGIDALGVDSLVEGISVRKRNVKIPVLVLGYTLPELFDTAREYDIAVTISSFESLEEAIKKGKNKKPLRVHLNFSNLRKIKSKTAQNYSCPLAHPLYSLLCGDSNSIRPGTWGTDLEQLGLSPLICPFSKRVLLVFALKYGPRLKVLHLKPITPISFC